VHDTAVPGQRPTPGDPAADDNLPPCAFATVVNTPDDENVNVRCAPRTRTKLHEPSPLWFNDAITLGAAGQ
jgi:hypothetical protein